MEYFNTVGTIIGVVIVVLGFLAAVAFKLQRLVKESKEFVEVIRAALEDRKITREELRHIFDEADDIAYIIREILVLAQQRK